MKLVLLTSFNADWRHGRIPAPYVPLNLLCLAAVARGEGHEPVIVDQTLALRDGKAVDGPTFHEQIAEIVAGHEPDVVGLTTMCNSYPQTLTLARECRKLAPTAKIVLGGPQATVVDIETMRQFDWIDAIVRNEADASLAAALARWREGADPTDVAGVTWRANGRIIRNPDAATLRDMDELPYPAYDLYPYAEIDPGAAPVEAGRGCPYGCEFCSTNVYFRRRYRIKSPSRLVAEMRFLHENHGFDRFDLVHDMLTVDARWVRQFCELLVASHCSFTWGCSARTDRVDDALLSTMADAGCVGMFFGVETGAQRMQPIVRKRLTIDAVLPVIRSCVDNAIAPTGSFITGFPEETLDDAVQSLDLALDILEMSPITQAQMHLLAPLPGSPVYARHKHELQFDGHSSDISLFLLTADEIQLVRRHPKIFPSFYHLTTPNLDRELAKAISGAVYTCHTLFIALRRAGTDLRALLRGWVGWKNRRVPEERIQQDYYMSLFGLDFCRYLREEVLDGLAASAHHLVDLVDYFEIRHALRRGLASEKIVFRRFDVDVRTYTAALRGAPHEADREDPCDLLFVDLSASPTHGYAFLEVAVPRAADAVVRPGDQLEIRDPVRQVLERQDLIIRNNTQQRAFATKHHLTDRQKKQLGLRRDTRPSARRQVPLLAGSA
nr:radical SAM protein [uncultured bacterium]AXL05629.1 radical SAM protein [uncultured bacterium]